MRIVFLAPALLLARAFSALAWARKTIPSCPRSRRSALLPITCASSYNTARSSRRERFMRFANICSFEIVPARTLYRPVAGLITTLLSLYPAPGATQGVHRFSCEPHAGITAVDLSDRVSEPFLRKMESIGVRTILRYYDSLHMRPTKAAIDTREYRLFAGRPRIALAVVFQHNSGRPETYLDERRAGWDANDALEQAKILRQPKGTAIYFGTDGADYRFSLMRGRLGLPKNDPFGYSKILPYFRTVHGKLSAAGYEVGVYGSGLSCKKIIGAGLARYCWFAPGPKLWPGREELLRTGRWDVKQHLQVLCGGKKIDFDEIRRGVSHIGQWTPAHFLRK